MNDIEFQTREQLVSNSVMFLSNKKIISLGVHNNTHNVFWWDSVFFFLLKTTTVNNCNPVNFQVTFI